MKIREPFIPINLSELGGSLCLLVAFVQAMIPGISGSDIPYWAAASFPFFLLGVLWRIHVWQQYGIRKNNDPE